MNGSLLNRAYWQGQRFYRGDTKAALFDIQEERTTMTKPLTLARMVRQIEEGCFDANRMSAAIKLFGKLPDTAKEANREDFQSLFRPAYRTAAGQLWNHCNRVTT